MRPTPPSQPPAGPPAGPAYGATPPGPGKKSRTGLWAALAAAAVVIIAAAVVVPLVVLAGDDDSDASTTTVSQTTSTDAPTSTSTSVAPTSTDTSASTSTSTTAAPSGPPGDSAGEWTEMDLPGVPTPALGVRTSDEALLVGVEGSAGGYDLYGYLFDRSTVVQLPVGGTSFPGEDLDGLLAVWWEGQYNEDTDEFFDEHLYAFRLPDGPRVEVAARSRMSYPQVAGDWITWAEGGPWEENPEEYALYHIYGVKVDANGTPMSEPVELVPSATAYLLGDSFWTYDLSETHLTWEQATAVGPYQAGLYTMDLSTREPRLLSTEAWRPSLAGQKIVYFQDGLKVTDLATGQTRGIDAGGDFPTAASTFAAYYRSAQTSSGSEYQIVARGYDGNHEQVLGATTEAPWLSPLIAASDKHVAFAFDGIPHVFQWQGQ